MSYLTVSFSLFHIEEIGQISSFNAQMRLWDMKSMYICSSLVCLQKVHLQNFNCKTFFWWGVKGWLDVVDNWSSEMQIVLSQSSTVTSPYMLVLCWAHRYGVLHPVGMCLVYRGQQERQVVKRRINIWDMEAMTVPVLFPSGYVLVQRSWLWDMKQQRKAR